MSDIKLPTPAELNAECRCLNLQRAARAVARRYDAALKPAGLTSGQFAILAALNRPDSVPLTGLAYALGLERTTLTRNLSPLRARRLVAVGGDDGDLRLRALSLTAVGRRVLADAVPLWRAAQAASAAVLEGPGWPTTRSALDHLSRL